MEIYWLDRRCQDQPGSATASSSSPGRDRGHRPSLGTRSYFRLCPSVPPVQVQEGPRALIIRVIPRKSVTLHRIKYKMPLNWGHADAGGQR